MKKLLKESNGRVEFSDCKHDCNKCSLEQCVSCNVHRDCFNKLLEYECIEESGNMIKNAIYLIERMYELAFPVQDGAYENVVIDLDKIVEIIKSCISHVN